MRTHDLQIKQNVAIAIVVKPSHSNVSFAPFTRPGIHRQIPISYPLPPRPETHFPQFPHRGKIFCLLAIARQWTPPQPVAPRVSRVARPTPAILAFVSSRPFPFPKPPDLGLLNRTPDGTQGFARRMKIHSSKYKISDPLRIVSSFFSFSQSHLFFFTALLCPPSTTTSTT